MISKIFGTVKLGALQLEVPRSLSWRYHDDGQVVSVEDHTLGLAKQYGARIPLPHQIRNSQGTVAIIDGVLLHIITNILGVPEILG